MGDFALSKYVFDDNRPISRPEKNKTTNYLSIYYSPVPGETFAQQMMEKLSDNNIQPEVSAPLTSGFPEINQAVNFPENVLADFGDYPGEE